MINFIANTIMLIGKLISYSSDPILHCNSCDVIFRLSEGRRHSHWDDRKRCPECGRFDWVQLPFWSSISEGRKRWIYDNMVNK